MAWQKYYEPFCLIMFPLAVTRLTPRDPGSSTRAAWGPIALAAALAVVTAATMKRGHSVPLPPSKLSEAQLLR
jgi:hypothetical protein